jgi:hypothetical protein
MAGLVKSMSRDKPGCTMLFLIRAALNQGKFQ